MPTFQFLSPALHSALSLVRKEPFFSPQEIRTAAKTLNALEKAMEKGQDRKAEFPSEDEPALLRKLILQAYDQGTAGGSSLGLARARSVLVSTDLPALPRSPEKVPFKITNKAKIVLRQLLEGAVVRGPHIDQTADIWAAFGEPDDRNDIDAEVPKDSFDRAKDMIETYLAGQVRDENNRKVGIPGHMSQGLVELLDFFSIQ